MGNRERRRKDLHAPGHAFRPGAYDVQEWPRRRSLAPCGRPYFPVFRLSNFPREKSSYAAFLILNTLKDSFGSVAVSLPSAMDMVDVLCGLTLSGLASVFDAFQSSCASSHSSSTW